MNDKISIVKDNNIINQKKLNKKKYSTFLKRKRLEQKKTLEDVSKGICTVSYLSRIENNLVDVSEEYYKKLFEKLSIDYNLLKEEKEHEIFNELLKCYLNKEENKAIDMISKALKTSYYVDLEYELMILFDNIARGLYTDARGQIIDLNTQIELLLNNELIFYLFLSSLYAYRTNQAIFALRQILILLEMDDVIDIYKYAIYDLALDIFNYTGQKELFYKYYNLISSEDYLTMYSKSSLKHKAQLLYNDYSLKVNQTFLYLSEIKDIIKDKYAEEIDYLILMNEYRFNNFNHCKELLTEITPTPFTIALESIIALSSEKSVDFYTLINHRNKVNFNQYTKIYELMFEICYEIKKYNNYNKAYDYMKELLNIQEESANFNFFFEIEKNIFMELAIKCGKYKDCLKRILSLSVSKTKTPYFL